MRRERSGPGLTEHLLQVEILLGHVRQVPHLLLQHRITHRKTSRHKTRGIAGSTPLRHGVTTPIHPRIVLSEPGVTQHHRGQGWVGDEERDGLWVVAWGDEGDGYRGETDRGSDCPLRALTEILWRRGTKGMWRSWAREMSSRLPSAPESSSAVPSCRSAAHCNLTGGGGGWGLLRDTPPDSSLRPTVGPGLLRGTSPGNGQPRHSIHSPLVLRRSLSSRESRALPTCMGSSTDEWPTVSPVEERISRC